MVTRMASPTGRKGGLPARSAVRISMPELLPEKHMSKMTYAEQLKHPNWQRRRLERLDDAGWECEDCGDTEKSLHVHHRRYVKGRMAWEYDDIELAVLCETCHDRAHASQKLLEELISTAPSVVVDLCIGIVSGYMYADCELSEELELRCRVGREPYFEVGVAAQTLTLLNNNGVRNLVRLVAESRSVTHPVRVLLDQWFDREANSSRSKAE